MQVDRAIRWIITLGIILLAVIVLGAALYLTESFFAVWDRLQTAPRWLLVVYTLVIVSFLTGTIWLIWRLIMPSRRPKLGKRESRPSESGINERLQKAQVAGVETTAASAELDKLGSRRDAGGYYIAFFGEISSGKSSLIKTFLGDSGGEETAVPQVSVRGGSTRRVQEYQGASYPGWVFADVPGTNEAQGTLDTLAIEEARRSHLVVYVCDSDLTRDDYEQIRGLCAENKPMILALNKSDQLNDEQQKVVLKKISERLSQLRTDTSFKATMHIVPVSAAHTQEVVRLLPDGSETIDMRESQPRIEALRKAVNAILSSDHGKLEKLRDSAVFSLAADKLDVAESHYREEQSRTIVQQYTKKAVVGAVAAVAPGTDILIQGVLATGLIREMCGLYDAPVKDLDIQKFLKQVQKHIGKALPVILAVSGNVMKAFPGIGTVAGGFTHAVAYGLVFDALGNSLAETLSEGEGFDTQQTTQKFRESLSNDLEARTARIAKMAMAVRKDPQ